MMNRKYVELFIGQSATTYANPPTTSIYSDEAVLARIQYLPVLGVKTDALSEVPFTFTVTCKGHCTVPRNARNVST